MRNISVLLCLALLVFSADAAGQKPKKPVTKAPVNTIQSREEPVTPGERFFFVMSLDGDGNSSTILRNEKGQALTPAENALFFSNLSRLGDSRLTPAARAALAPGVMIKPYGALKYKKLAEAVRAARNPSDLRVVVETGDDFYLGIKKKPDLKKPPRPNPMTLVLTVDNEDRLYLNNEPHGSLSNTSELSNYLKSIFKDRENNGVFREATNVIETTVFLNPRDDLPIADLMKLVNVLREAGSDTVELVVDPLGPPMIKLDPHGIDH